MNKTSIIQQYKRDCQEIIEKYIGCDDFSKKQLLEDLEYITQAHFDDIVDERTCSRLCGYVCCSNLLIDHFKPTQKYHIKKGKVYNIERRKHFCSDLCFKRSDFLRVQVCPEPVYLRKNERSQSFQLYEENKGLLGDEVKLKSPLNCLSVQHDSSHSNNKTKPQKVLSENDLIRNEKSIQQMISSPYVKEEVFTEIKNKFDTLTIKEKNVIQSNRAAPLSSQSLKTLNKLDSKEKDKQNTANLDSEFEATKISTSIENISIFSFSERNSLSDFTTITKKNDLKKKKYYTDLLTRLDQWITNETRKYLNIDEVCLDETLVAIMDDEQSSAERYRAEYIRLCDKLNKEEHEDEMYDQMVLNEKNKKKPILKNEKNTKTGNSHQEKRNQSSSKIVRFNEECEIVLSEHNEEVSGLSKTCLFFPSNEGLNPNFKRKQLFLVEIQQFICEVFDAELEINEINDMLNYLKELVNTFNVTATNTRMGKSFNFITSIVLLRFLVLCEGFDKNRLEIVFDNSTIIRYLMNKFNISKEIVDKDIKNLLFPSKIQ